MKAVSLILLILLLLGVSTLELRVQLAGAESTTWFVDDDGPADFSSIQEAINSPLVVDGDTVYVYNGTYYEHIVLNKTVFLIGEDRSSTIIDGNRTGTVVKIISSNVVITGFTIQNGGDAYPDFGVYCEWVTNVSIGHNVVTGNYYGIWLYGSGRSSIFRNSINENGYYGVFIQDSYNNTVRENKMAENLWGLFLFCSYDNYVWRNNVTDNRYGIQLDCSPENTLRENVMTNNFYNLGLDGINLEDFTNEVNLSNTINSKPVYYLIEQTDVTIPFDAGYIALVNCKRITVRNLNLNHNTQGILCVHTQNSTITENNLTNNVHGIFLYNSFDNSVYTNNITGNLIGVWPLVSSDNKFCHNNFIDNAEQVNLDQGIFGNHVHNSWNNSYPIGGNYWSDGTHADGDGDGIADMPYVIDTDNTDHYPLMSPYWYWRNPMICDVNRDMKVDIKDIAIVAKAYGSYPGYPNWNPHADIYEDDKVDIKDIAMVAKQYGTIWS